MPNRDVPDPIDARILGLLLAGGRRSYADIASEVGISGPSIHDRVKKLEARGVIRGYRAVVDPSSVGFGVLAFTWVTQAPGTATTDLTALFAEIPEVEECHHIAGEADYLLKLRARDTQHLERVIKRVSTTSGVFTTETSVVFSTGFEGRPLPLASETDEPSGT